eukprot:SAG11_NODE_18163_length_498_cov_1.035088_2_plen_32_part_01
MADGAWSSRTHALRRVSVRWRGMWQPFRARLL